MVQDCSVVLDGGLRGQVGDVRKQYDFTKAIRNPYAAGAEAALEDLMIIADLSTAEGRRYPAGRLTQNLVGGKSNIQARHFCMGHVTLDPNGGQVPWHNHSQEEVYVVLEGEGEVCVGAERQPISGGQAVYIPADLHHQLTNTGDKPLRMIYCYAPTGDVSHWRQELDGTLPRAGIEAPPLPGGAWPQHGGQ